MIVKHQMQSSVTAKSAVLCNLRNAGLLVVELQGGLWEPSMPGTILLLSSYSVRVMSLMASKLNNVQHRATLIIYHTRLNCYLWLHLYRGDLLLLSGLLKYRDVGVLRLQ